MAENQDLKMDGKTLDITKENIAAMKQLFPEIVTDGKIDFEKLRLILGDEVETSDERYNFTWHGKNQAIRLSQTPSMGTLRPCKEDSVNWDTTKNLYIEGDNLEVLKLLQRSYFGRIKMIYIDPPYNTGGDFVYSDDYTDSLSNYLLSTGQALDSKKISTNVESNGRFHTNWLNMIYPRLKVARNLLTDDGAIFISIDDNELFNCKKICDEIFGELNFVNCITVKMSELSGVKMKSLNKYPKLKESLLIYAKDYSCLKLIVEKKRKSSDSLEDYLKYYSQIIINPESECSEWIIQPLNSYFKDHGLNISKDNINQWKINNSKRLVYRTNSRTVSTYIKNNPDAPSICKIINNDGEEIFKWDDKQMLFLSNYLDEYLGDIWMDISTINLNKETSVSIYENGQKPLALLTRIIKSIDMHDEDIILDFFSGSATTAHAILKCNQTDSIQRRFIMIQLPVNLDQENSNESVEKAISFLDGINKPHNLSEIGKERIRRAESEMYVSNQTTLDGVIKSSGFRVFKLDSSNIRKWSPGLDLRNSLLSFENNLISDPDRKDMDVVFEILLKLGLDLNSNVEEKQNYYSVENGTLMICLKDVESLDVAQAMIDEYKEKEPLVWKVVFKDNGFASDDVKANTRETLKMAGLQDGSFITL